MKIELNETEQQYLIDSMMFYSTFMQYFKNDNRGSYSRLINNINTGMIKMIDKNVNRYLKRY